MKLSLSANLLGVVGVLFAVASLQYTEGIKCPTCKYSDYAGKVNGDSKCKFGDSDTFEECGETSPGNSTAAIQSGPKYRVACLRLETSAQETELQFLSVWHVCGFSLQAYPGCTTTTIQRTLNTFPALDPELSETRGNRIVNITDKECVCFTDDCKQFN